MDLKKAAVWEEFYFGLKANGWSKEEAAKAAHRHVRQMSRRKINEEVTRILASRQAKLPAYGTPIPTETIVGAMPIND
jgi:hypothetical protein